MLGCGGCIATEQRRSRRQSRGQSYRRSIEKPYSIKQPSTLHNRTTFEVGAVSLDRQRRFVGGNGALDACGRTLEFHPDSDRSKPLDPNHLWVESEAPAARPKLSKSYAAVRTVAGTHEDRRPGGQPTTMESSRRTRAGTGKTPRRAARRAGEIDALEGASANDFKRPAAVDDKDG